MTDPTPPARRSTHVDVDADSDGTPLVDGSETAPTSRAARRRAKEGETQESALPAFFRASAAAASAQAESAEAETAAVAASAIQAPDDDASSRRRKPVLIAMGAAIVTLLVALGFVGASIAANLAEEPEENADQPGGGQPAAPERIEFAADTPAGAAGAGPCTTVRVLSSFENAEMVEKLAAGYNAAPRDIDGLCVTVTASKAKSGTAAEDAAASFARFPADQRPTLWLPDSSMWLAAAGDDAPVGETASVAYSDIVPAMPHSLAAAIRWDEKAPTWAELIAAGADAGTWADHGRHELGAFKLGKTSPLVATSGAAAMLAAYGVAGGGVGEVTSSDVQDAEVRSAVHEQELATSHYMATPEHFLWHARQAETKGSAADFLSAVIVDEKSVWDYNRGIVSRDGVTRTLEDPPADPLVPIYPADGAYVADNPAVPVTGDWVDAAEKAATADFIRFTQSAEGQQIVRASGYRDLNRELDDDVERVGRLSTAGTKTQLSPDAGALVAGQAAFPEVRKRANVLFLLDVSGSMDEPISATETKLSQAKKAIESALEHFTAGDDVGLAAFAQAPDGTLVPGAVRPVADIATTREDFIAGLRGITSMGDTPLYQAVASYAQAQAAAATPDHINAIVLLSDGENDVKVPTTDVATMNAALAGIPHDKHVLIFTLAYGADADVATLQGIAGATGAHYYDATDPTTLSEVLGDLVTSF